MMNAFPTTPPRQPILPIHDPDSCWSTLEESQDFRPVPTIISSAPRDDKGSSTRIVCISDTHGKHRSVPVPNCDILIHGGDFTKTGELSIIKDLDSHFLELQQKNIVKEVVCIAGNHDITFHPDLYQTIWKTFHPRTGPLDCTVARQSLQNCVYLEDQLHTVNVDIESGSDKNRNRECDEESNSNSKNTANDRSGIGKGANIHNNHEIKVYGSPWSPTFGYGWGFNQDRDTIYQKWDLIPKDHSIDILVTHGPPLGRGDRCISNNRAGCLDLLRTVQNDVKPRVHIFGHIHEDSGCSFDGQTLFVNASSVDLRYRPTHPCIVLDLPHDKTLPAKVVKPYSTLDGEGVIRWLGQKVQENHSEEDNDMNVKSYKDLIPFFENASPKLTGVDLINDNINYEQLACVLQMHREPNLTKLIRNLGHAVLQLRAESYN
jgi:Icc-related predicted phosphoesterase